MKTQGATLPAPRVTAYIGGVLRSGVRCVADVIRDGVSGHVCVGDFDLRLYEFVWGVNVLTKIVQKCTKTRGYSGRCFEVSHFIQDKERRRSGGLASRFILPERYLEGTEYL